jgi:hypothetical protein
MLRTSNNLDLEMNAGGQTITAGNVLVRAIYLATAVFATSLGLFVFVLLPFDLLRSPIRSIGLLILTAVLFVLPGARALRRLFINGTVIPPALINERPVVAWVVSLAGSSGHIFFVILMSVAFDLALRTEWPDDVGGPFAFVFMLTMLSYLISLLCGELALVGNGQSDAARATSRVPFS